MNNTNPYSQAATNQGIPQTQLEAEVLIKYASKLNQIKENWEENKNCLDDVLEKNRKIWTILVDEINTEENKLPVEIKQNIVNLAFFIFKKTVSVMAHPEPEALDSLININMNIARGLNQSPK